MELDPLDSAILSCLVKDGRLSFRELAAKVSSTTPTVSARVKALEELGIIQGYHAALNPDILGGPLRLLIVHTSPHSATDVASALAAAEAVEKVEVLAGGRVHAYVRERSHAGVRAPHELLAQRADVSSYEVAEVLAVPRNAPPALDPGGIDVPCHQCKGPIHGQPVRAKIGDRAHVFCCTHCLETFRERVTKLGSSGGTASTQPHHKH